MTAVDTLTADQESPVVLFLRSLCQGAAQTSALGASERVYLSVILKQVESALVGLFDRELKLSFCEAGSAAELAPQLRVATAGGCELEISLGPVFAAKFAHLVECLLSQNEVRTQFANLLDVSAGATLRFAAPAVIDYDPAKEPAQRIVGRIAAGEESEAFLVQLSPEALQRLRKAAERRVYVATVLPKLRAKRICLGLSLEGELPNLLCLCSLRPQSRFRVSLPDAECNYGLQSHVRLDRIIVEQKGVTLMEMELPRDEAEAEHHMMDAELLSGWEAQLFRDLGVKVAVEMGEVEMTALQLLNLCSGAAFKVQVVPEHEVKLSFEGEVVASGKLVQDGDEFLIEITEIHGDATQQAIAADDNFDADADVAFPGGAI